MENKNDIKQLEITTMPITLCKRNDFVTLTDEVEHSSSSESDSDIELNKISNSSNTSSTNNNFLNNGCSPNTATPDSLCVNNTSQLQFGMVSVQNSSDLTFGNKTYYHGPVTIVNNQHTYENDEWKPVRGEANSSSEQINVTLDNKKNVTENGDSKLGRKKICVVTAIVTLVLLSTALTTLYLIIRSYNSDDHDASSSGSENATTKQRPEISNGVRVITSKEWTRDLDDLPLPVQQVIIAQTESPACSTQDSCELYIRSFHKYHVKTKGWEDIAYNFLVGGDGAVYEGRGWNKIGAHSRQYNANSICIAFIGKFFTIKPPQRQIDAAKKLIEDGVKWNKITLNYRLYGHCQLIATDSPGEALYDIIKTWDHWSENVTAIN